MPPPCNRCRQSQAAEGDSWCLACTGWEALGRDLAGTWDSPGCRAVASDLVVSCVRQIRALRNLGAGLSRASSLPVAGGGPPLPAGRDRGRSAVPAVTAKSVASPRRPSLPRLRTSEAPPPPTVKSEDTRDEEHQEEESEEEDEAEEDEAAGEVRRSDGGHRRPPEPEGSPRRRGGTGGGLAGSTRANSRDRRHSREERGQRDRDRTRSGRRRGGRKHQRLYRCASNPELRVHRKPPNSYWDLGTETQGRQALDRL